MFVNQFSGAIFDAHRNYRFILWRYWNDNPRILFIGLNPSTADEAQNDPTIRRCISFSQLWNYGGMYFCNLFGYISTDPKSLSKTDSIHPANIHAIQTASSLTILTVAAWGDGIEIVDNGRAIAQHLKELISPSKCFGLTQKGNPKHPLYLPGVSQLLDY